MDADQYAVHAEVDQDHWWWRARREFLDEVISAYAPATPNGLTLAEAGCAAGGNLSMLSRHGRVIAAEPNAIALERLRRIHPDLDVIEHAIPEPLPERVDVLCLFDVLEHLPDDKGALRWIAESLKDDGIAVITVPAFQYLWTEQDDVLNHLRRYAPGEIEKILPAELEPVHGTCFNSLLFAPILAVRRAMQLRRRSGPPRSHLGMPPAPLNELLYRIFRLERRLLVRRRAPLGVSILLVARRRPR